MWMIMELMKNLSLDVSNKEPRVIIYDRGMIDRIPWLDFDVKYGSMSVKDSMLLKQWYSSDFLNRYRPLTYGLVTSPELSVLRKGKEGRLVNRKNVGIYNECLDKEHSFISSVSGKYTTIQTDPYQGKLQTFIMEMTEKITTDVKEQVKNKMLCREKEQENEEKKKEEFEL